MSYTFEVRFAGLCAFVPERTLDDPRNRVTVLLADPTAADADEVLSRAFEPHSPVLRFNLKDLAGGGSNGTAGELKASHELHDADVMYYLCRSQEDSSQAFPLNAGVRIVCDSRGTSDYPLSLDEERDFTWLPCVNDVLPGVEINPDFLEDRYFDYPDSQFVAARIHLGEGELRTEHVARHNHGPVVARFVPTPQQTVQQAMAEWVNLSVTVPDGFDVLIRTRLAGKEEEDLVRLRPKGDRMRVEISNLCCGQYIEEGVPSKRPNQDADFEAHFLLSKDARTLKDSVGLLPIPAPVHYPGRKNGSSQAGGSTGLQCTGSYYRRTSTNLSLTTSSRMPQSAPSGSSNLPIAFQDLSPLGQPLAAATFAAPSAPAVRLNLVMEAQLKSQLCWAAVARCVADHYEEDPKSQCGIVEGYLGISGCCPDCEKSECNAPGSTSEVLKDLGHLQGVPIAGAVSFKQVQQEISQRRPIVAGIGANDSDHVVVIDGWTNAGDKEHLWILDPKNGAVRLWRFEDFKKNSGFEWQATYLTQ